LQATLELYGYHVFVDHSEHDGLRAEEPWESSLQKYCTEANYMIVLWSERTVSKCFVHTEIKWRIEEYRRDASRRVILLPLNDFRDAPMFPELEEHYGNRQAFRGFIDLYSLMARDVADADNGADQIEHFAWHDSARRFIEEAIPDAAKRIIEVPVVVVAMTRQQAEELTRGENLRVSRDLFDRYVNSLTSVRAFDVSTYGDKPEDWRPLPEITRYNWSSHSIRDILSIYERERRKYINVNRGLLDAKPEYRLNRVYLPYTSQIMSSDQRPRAIQKLQKRPCLVFVDPISLMHRSVYRWYDAFKSSVENKFTIGISPLVPILHKYFDDYLAYEAELLDEIGLMASYENFHSFFNDALKASVMSVDHGYELTRWVQFASDNIARYLSDRGPDPNWINNDKLKVGPTQPLTF
jgi:hypothetical protein